MSARLPQPGSDDGTWGDILNQFLLVAHNSDGSLSDSRIAGALQKASNLSDIASPVTARTNLGLGDAATHPASDFSGSPAGTSGKPLAATDATTTNARTPLAHAASHAAAGSDPISINASQVNAGVFASARIPDLSGTYSVGEVNSASNTSGTPDVVAPSASVNATACIITIQPSSKPIWIYGKTTLQQTSAGTGTINISLVDYTNSQFLEYSFVPLPNTVGRLFSGTVSYRLPSLSTAITVGLLVGNNPDTSQTASVSIQNSSSLPSQIWAVAS